MSSLVIVSSAFGAMNSPKEGPAFILSENVVGRLVGFVGVSAEVELMVARPRMEAPERRAHERHNESRGVMARYRDPGDAIAKI